MVRVCVAHDDLIVSLRDELEFFSVVKSASGVNIAIEVGWLFDLAHASAVSVSGCYIRLQLSDGCVDERLSLFLDELTRCLDRDRR